MADMAFLSLVSRVVGACQTPLRTILDFMNAQYYTEIDIGTPAQTVSA